MFQPNEGFPRPRMRTVGRQTPQLCARKVGHNEARRLSPAFGKDELNLGIAQSPSTRRIEPHPAPLRPQWRERPACAGTIVLRARPVAEIGCTKIGQQMTDWSFCSRLQDA